MALTIKKATGGTAYALQDTSLDRWFEVVEGDLHGIPAARVVNTVIPGATGQAPDGAPVDDSMVVRVHGYISGIGSTKALRVASYRAQRAALKAQVVSAGTLVTLTATAPTMGLVSAEVGTITAQFQRFLEPNPAPGDEVQELTIELLALSDPVAWAVA